MYRWIFLTILLLGVFASGGFAEKDNLQDVLQALESPFRKEAALSGDRIDDFQAEFSQQSHIASIDRTQQGSGAVSFKFIWPEGKTDSGAMFRWEYREPTVQEILSDGRTMWYYLPENRQVIKSDMDQVSSQQGENPVTFLSGLGRLSRDFSVSWGSPERDVEGNPVLELRPHQASQYINRLEVVVAREAADRFSARGEYGKIFPIVSTTVVDPNGNRTAISFHKVRFNQGLADERFHFQVPEGVEVVLPSEQGLGF